MSEENEPYTNPAIEEKPATDEAAASEPTEVEGAEPSPEKEAEPTPEPTDDQKKESKVQKRIDQITKEKHEARAEAEYWRKVATGEITPEKTREPQPEAPAGKPVVEDFETYEEFVEALTDWKVESKEAAKREQTAKQEAANRAQTIAEKNNARIEAARTTYTDFDDVVTNLNGIMVPPVTIEAIQESELSAEVFYYLGNNVEEAKKLQTMSVSAQLREIGRIEEKVSKKPEPEPKRISAAPVPLNPVGTSVAATAKDIDSIDDDEEWLKRENARLKKAGRLY